MRIDKIRNILIIAPFGNTDVELGGMKHLFVLVGGFNTETVDELIDDVERVIIANKLIMYLISID